MAVFLTVMLSGLSLGILAGRIYEILNLTDVTTGFFYYKGIVFTPYVLGLFVIITLCCGEIIFGDKKNETPFFSKSSKIIAVAAGAMFITYGVMSYGTDISCWFTLAGGAALVLLGIFELHNKGGIMDILISILLVVFIIGISLDVVIFDVYTIHNISFIKNALSFICTGMFFLAVFKNIFAPKAKSRMFLYVTGMLASVTCGIMNVADIAGMAISDTIAVPELFFHAGFAFLGFFAFDNAASALPRKKAESALEENEQEDEGTVKVYKKEELQGETAAKSIPAQKLSAQPEHIPNAETAEINNPGQKASTPVLSKEFDLSKNKEFTQFFSKIEEKAEQPKKTEKMVVKQTFKADKNGGGKVVYRKPK